MNDGYVVIDVDLNTKQFDAQIKYIESEMKEIEYKLKQADMGIEVGDVQKLEAQYEKLGNQLGRLVEKKQEFNQPMTATLDINNAMDGINKKTSSVLTRIRNWGLALIGIRSLYGFLSSAASTVGQNNEKIGNDLKNIRTAIAMTLEPVITKIINLIKTLMAYVNYVWNRLFGKDLFKASAKSLQSGASSAKEINKQLAGFDEANVLSDSSSSASGTSGSSNDNGFFDDLSKVKIPDWLKNLMDWVDKHPTLSKILFGGAVFTLLGGMKLAGGVLSIISSVIGKAGTGATLTGASGLAGILGYLLVLAGTAYIIYLDYHYISEAVEAYKDLRKSQDNIRGATKKSTQSTKEASDAYWELVDAGKETEQQTNNVAESLLDIIDINNSMSETTKGNVKSWALLKQENMHDIVELKKLYDAGKLTTDQQKRFAEILGKEVIPNLDLSTKQGRELYNTYASLNKSFVTNYTQEIITKFKEEGLSGIFDKIKNLTNKLGEIFGSFGTSLTNVLKTTLGGLFNSSLTGKSITTAVTIATGLGTKLKSIFKKDGGIINLPGRGVPIGGYTIGERGAEGIVPLDNSNEMEELGRSIAKYVNINNIVNNYMDSKKLNSLLKASASREALATNR